MSTTATTTARAGLRLDLHPPARYGVARTPGAPALRPRPHSGPVTLVGSDDQRAELIAVTAATGHLPPADEHWEWFSLEGSVPEPQDELVAGEDSAIVLIRGRCPSRRARDMLVAFNLLETQRHIRSLPGFRAASFFSGVDGRSFLEVVRWEAPKALQQAFGDDDFQAHLHVNHHYSETAVQVMRAEGPSRA